ncbi:phosphatidate cytidylyltransferase [Phocaeicola sp.]
MAVREKNTGKFSDVPIRIRSWIIIIAVLAIGLIHPALTCLLFAALSCMGLKEYLALEKVKDNKVLYSLLPLSVFQYAAFYTGCYLLFLCLTPLYALLAGLWWRKMRIIVTGVIINILALGHLAFIASLNQTPMAGTKLLLFLLILTEWNDVFQYLTGKCFGKRKITPRISPNKTVEGLIGGVLLTTALACGMGTFLIPDRSIVLYLCLGVVISLTGFCGDLFISYLKRKAGVKDTGTLIPGHGGLLDRMDSLIFISPLFYVLIHTLILP